MAESFSERMTAKAMWTLVMSLFPMIAAISLVPVVLRHVGNVQYGILQVALGVSGLLAMADMNLGLALTRAIAGAASLERNEEFLSLARVGMAIFLTIGLVLTCCILFAAPWLARHVVNAKGVDAGLAVDTLRLAGFALFPLFLNTYAIGIANGLHRYIVPTAINSANLVTTTVGNALLAINGSSVVQLMLWNAVVSYVAIAVLLSYVGRLSPAGSLRPGYSREQARGLLTFASFSWLGRLSGLVASVGDRLVVSSTLGAAAVPAYAIPMGTLRYFASAAGTLGSSLLPVVAHADARADSKSLRALYIRSARIFATIAVGLPLFAVSGSHILITAWLGPSFSRAAPVMILGGLSVCLTILTMVPSYLVDGLGKPQLTSILRLAQVAAGFVLAVPLLNAWGAAGAAAAFLIPALATVPLFLRLVEARFLGMGAGEAVQEIYLRPALVGSCVVLTGLALERHASFGSLSGAMVFLAILTMAYGILVVLFRPVPLKELRVLSRSFKHLRRPASLDRSVPN